MQFLLFLIKKMAKKIYDEKIDKYINWGGDEKTENLPVSGNRVQEFIKETLDQKAGVFYYDASNNRYLVFSDEDNRDMYLEDPTLTDLLIGAFDAPFNYTATIDLLTPTYQAILTGEEGNIISFTFSVVNKAGQETGDNVYCTYTFINGATKQKVSAKYRTGETAEINIDKYLKEGTNTIIVGIVGENTLAATTVSITYQVVNLKIVNDLDISKPYTTADTLEATCIVEGYGTKIIEWYIDGKMLELNAAIDEVTSQLPTSRTRYIDLSNLGLSEGVHTFQVRVYTTINGEKFYSKTLYREFAIKGTSNLVMMACELPIGEIAVGRTMIYAKQYEEFSMTISAYSPENHTLQVDAYLNDVLQASFNISNGETEKFNLSPVEYNTLENPGEFKFVVGEEIFAKDIYIEKSKIAIEEITEKLLLSLSATGKSNNSPDKDSWTFGDYTTKFTGFEWNEYSGWNGGYLVIPNGASVQVSYAPLAANAVNTGKTLEFEFATKDVENDDAVLVDIINDNGVGLKITASEATLISSAKNKLTTKYASGENIRISFVINRKSSVVEKGLAYLYVNGILCGATNYDTNSNFMSGKWLNFAGSEGATLLLKSVRIYDMALSAEQILNNFALYSTGNERLNIVRRNDILDGTSFDYSKVANQLPVMIVTGSIPTLEDTTDKNTSIVVDIEYINSQNPEYSFTLKNAQMKPQGTSSMGYPKKNFRFYTTKRADTKLYDANGKLVENGLYAFKPGSIPVNCWCLKADYAESSGTHNTGVARLWNDVMKNARYDGKYVLRTEAQNKAIENGYNYDVRTTIDGFPIAMFYRLTADSDLVFLGKYNFNNDKSTENVFGFKNIPGFDNSHMQCWEVLNNGSPLALFTDVSTFSSKWEEAYESRFPDTSNPPALPELKAFCEWVNNPGDFATTKWQHLDVYKVAAYYIYLMRFGAVDQTVKNSMLTSEDGAKYFFINYDNDTVNGLRNDGPLVFGPDITRQTLDTSVSGAYCYAGHESKLWNALEADAEFMSIVSKIDNALYEAGLSYENVTKIFNEEQSEKWCERIYNEDSKYKYITPFTQSNTNNLFMCQGDRKSHRKWWLSKRFAMFDAEWVSGPYKSESIFTKFAELVSTPDEPHHFSIVSGHPFKFGYGINNDPVEYGISLDKDASHEFSLTRTINVGDPIRVYGAYYIKELNFSEISSNMTQLDLTNIIHKNLGTKLTKLVLGNSNVNNALESISGLTNATKLEYLDIEGFKGIKNIDLTSLKNLKYINASRSSISSLEFNDAGKIEEIHCPDISTLIIKNSNITWDNIHFDTDINSLRNITIKNCPNLMQWSVFESWLDALPEEEVRPTLTLDGIDWEVELNSLLKLEKVVKNLRGKIRLTLDKPDTPADYQQILEHLKEVFGDTIYDPLATLYIEVPSLVFITEFEPILEGDSKTVDVAVYPEIEMDYYDEWDITGDTVLRPDVIVNNGVITSTENNEGNVENNFILLFTRYYEDGAELHSEIPFKVLQRTYPDTFSFTGPTSISVIDAYPTPSEYTLQYRRPADPIYTGAITITWDTIGEMWQYMNHGSVDYEDRMSVYYVMPTSEPEGVPRGDLMVTVRKAWNNELLYTDTISIEYLAPSVIMTSYTNPPVMAAMYAEGLAPREDYMTATEAAAVKVLPVLNQYSFESFDELQYFTGLKEIPANCFNGMETLRYITTPKWTYKYPTLQTKAFAGCINLERITIPPGVQYIMDYLFDNCVKLTSIELPNTVLAIGPCCFFRCTGLSSFHLPASVTFLDDNILGYCNLKSITVDEGNTVYDSRNNCNAIIETATNKLMAGCVNTVIPETVTSIRYLAYYGNLDITSIELPDTITSIGENAFWGCKNLVNVKLPANLTKIETGLFRRCTALNSIEIPASVTRVESYVFTECNNLTSVDFLRESSYTMNNYVFVDCWNLQSITFRAATAPSIYSGTFSNCGTNVTGEKLLNVPFEGIGYESATFVSSLIGKYKYTLNKVRFGYPITSESNSPLMNIMYSAGLAADPEKMTWEEVDAVTSSDLIQETSIFTTYNNSENPLVTFDEFRWFTGVDFIDVSMFEGIDTLTSIRLPNTVTTIDNYAFKNCTGLASVELSSTLVDMEEGVFQGCTNLTHCALPSTIAAIGRYTFADSGITECFEFRDQIVTITEGLFMNCVNLTTIYLPESLETIESYAFSGCSNLDLDTLGEYRTPIFPSSLTRVGDYAFYGCQSSSLSIPSTISFGTGAFKGCSVNVVVFEEGCTSIADEMFKDCSSLTLVRIPSTCTSIGNYAFTGCLSLGEIVSYAFTAPTAYAETFGDSSSNYVGKDATTRKLYVPYAATGYETVEETGYNSWVSVLLDQNSANFDIVYANENDEATTYITFPTYTDQNDVWTWKSSDMNLDPSVYNAFESTYNSDWINTGHAMLGIKVSGLAQFRIYISCLGDSLTESSTYVLVGELDVKPTVDSYKRKIITNHTPSTEASGLSYYDMVEFNLPDTNEHTIYISYYKSKITHFDYDAAYILIPKAQVVVTPTSNSALWGLVSGSASSTDAFTTNDAAALSDVTGKETLTSFNELRYFTGITIESQFMEGNNNITSISLPYNCTSIGSHAFNNCANLMNIGLPENLTNIGGWAFANDMFTSIKIPNTVTIINQCAFQYTKLASISLPNSLTHLGQYSFDGATDLIEVTIGNTIRETSSLVAETCVFNNCLKLNKLTINIKTAPTFAAGAFGEHSSAYAGTSATNNKLYIPTGATGYNVKPWSNPLCVSDGCNFTIEYI